MGKGCNPFIENIFLLRSQSASDGVAVCKFQFARKKRIAARNRSFYNFLQQSLERHCWEKKMLQTIDPAILYFGTPVLLVSSVNEDGSANLAPMSSAWWLGNRCMLGFGARSKTPQNIIRTGECVLNLPSDSLVDFVDRLALTTGSDPVPPHKIEKGYRHVKDKFSQSGFTAIPSQSVAAQRVAECPVQMEATLVQAHALEQDNPERQGALVGLEVCVRRVHIDNSILMEGHNNRIDPDLWRPLIMSFQQFYGLGPRLHPSTLATIPEEMYRIKRSLLPG